VKKMADNKAGDSNKPERGDEKDVHIEPSESKTSKTGDPGRTPGKAEGEDDESATK
jgi:hypothetical protein